MSRSYFFLRQSHFSCFVTHDAPYTQVCYFRLKKNSARGPSFDLYHFELTVSETSLCPRTLSYLLNLLR